MGITKCLALAGMLLATLSLSAQTVRTITGTVVDDQGEPVIGAAVRTNATPPVSVNTDIDGNFTLKAATGQTIEITYVGCRPAKVKITDADTYNIVLETEANTLNEVVAIGYGTQKKATLTGAVSSLGGDEMVVSKAQDAKNMLTGKIPGVRVTQNTSEPGNFDYGNFDIRGYGSSPLIVVDGVPRGNFERLDPNEIESISVLKDASAAIYGAQGGNGVILVTTKKGTQGRAKVTYSMYYGIQTPAEVLRPVGSVERMTLFNEKSMRSLTNPVLTYTDDQINAYLTGEKISTDWYDAVMAGHAPQQQHNVGVSGGTEKVDYFVNFSYMDQKGFFKSNDLDYNRYNVRANINASITDYLRFSTKIAGTLDERTAPYNGSSYLVFNYLWRSVPDETIYANNNTDYLSKPSADIQNPVGMMDFDKSGYQKTTNKIFTSTFTLELDVPGVKGLKLKGLFSYDNTIKDVNTWQSEYNEYTYDAATETYTAYTRQSPAKLTRSYSNSWSRNMQGSINYDNTFGLHHVSALFLYEQSYSKYDDLNGSRYFTLSIPYMYAGDSEDQVVNGGNISETARRAWVGRLAYDFDQKYLLEFAFRYDGSSKFAKGHQWGFFPSVQAGWRISEEAFMKSTRDWLDQLKIRGSWGKMGDDSCAAYQFVSGYNYPNTSGSLYNNYPKGYVFDGTVVNSLGFRSVANPLITWYTIKTTNIGIDADFFHSRLGFTAEFFIRNRDGLLATRNVTVPGTFGSTMSQENINSDRTKGFELELRHNNRLGDFTYHVSGNMSITRTQWHYYERNPSGNSMENWRSVFNTDRYNDIWFGYGSNGRYTDWNSIQYANVYTGNSVLPGDYIYEDWNGDGVIDSNDMYPIATTTNPTSDLKDKKNHPLLNFGITLGGEWKGFDLTATFQGSAMSYVAYSEQLSQPLAWNGNALDLFLDRWHPADAKADPYDPTTKWISGYYSYGGTTPQENSEFSIQKGDYVRLKNLEVGYTLPYKWTKVCGVQNLRVYFSSYNLFTITGVKGMDPEKPSTLYGYMYPLNRSYNFGASITF